MICKERDPQEHPESDKFAKAGAGAEEQMAFYLRRAFAESQDIRVFNDLRFVVEGSDDAAQIDHLILHRSGMVLIESKSVTSEVRINKNGEWARIWSGRAQGMASPILQTQRQADLLKTFLRAAREQLLGKFFFGLVQKGFGYCPMDVLVAISDSGIVKRQGGDFPEVCKADQVPGKVKEIIEKRYEASNPLNVKEDGWLRLKDEEMEKITQFFLQYHYPRSLQEQAAQAQNTPSIVSESAVAPQNIAGVPPEDLPYIPKESLAAISPSSPQDATGLGVCPKCKVQGVIVWGKFGYYWKCPSCQGNTAIKEFCPKCRQKMKLRKDKDTFYKRCEVCKAEEVYWTAV